MSLFACCREDDEEQKAKGLFGSWNQNLLEDCNDPSSAKMSAKRIRKESLDLDGSLDATLSTCCASSSSSSSSFEGSFESVPSCLSNRSNRSTSSGGKKSVTFSKIETRQYSTILVDDVDITPPPSPESGKPKRKGSSRRSSVFEISSCSTSSSTSSSTSTSSTSSNPSAPPLLSIGWSFDEIDPIEVDEYESTRSAGRDLKELRVYPTERRIMATTEKKAARKEEEKGMSKVQKMKRKMGRFGAAIGEILSADLTSV